MNRFLKIASDNLVKARRIKNKDFRALSKQDEYAITIVICSGCAVECHTNELITLALFRKDTAKGRKQISLLINRCLKASIRDKLTDISRICPISKDLKNRLKTLFEERNRIVHVVPQCNEGKYVPDDIFKQGGAVNIDPDNLPTRPSMALFSLPADYIKTAEAAFKTASDYISAVSHDDYFRNLA